MKIFEVVAEFLRMRGTAKLQIRRSRTYKGRDPYTNLLQ